MDHAPNPGSCQSIGSTRVLGLLARDQHGSLGMVVPSGQRSYSQLSAVAFNA